MVAVRPDQRRSHLATARAGRRACATWASSAARSGVSLGSSLRWNSSARLPSMSFQSLGRPGAQRRPPAVETAAELSAYRGSGGQPLPRSGAADRARSSRPAADSPQSAGRVGATSTVGTRRAIGRLAGHLGPAPGEGDVQRVRRGARRGHLASARRADSPWSEQHGHHRVLVVARGPQPLVTRSCSIRVARSRRRSGVPRTASG